MTTTFGEFEQQPIGGLEAFGDSSGLGVAGRAAHLLTMSVYAFTNAASSADVRDDADLLGTPHIRAAGDTLQEWRTQDALDLLTEQAVAHHVNSDVAVSVREHLQGRPADFDEFEVMSALWTEIDRYHLPTTLLAVLNLRQRSRDQLEAVAAAAGLHTFSGSALELSSSILQEATRADDELARGLAQAVLGTAADVGPQPAAPKTTTAEPVSTTIHGTWGLVDDDGWYRPGSDLHNHLTQHLGHNLYAADAYFVWSGGYSDLDRTQGAHDLVAWRPTVSSADWFDIVYAHSHGGNVALSAAASGQRIRMLVLLHTPAIHRSDTEWQAIRSNVGGVVVMRTRMDLVVLGDTLRHGEARSKFNPSLLPHFAVTGHWRNANAWFSHSFYVKHTNWDTYHLADIVRTRYNLT